ncbi:MAG: class I SAM-dependent rRNA methyltransferase [Anaerolineae bacterium]|nr:class I SAM-dependent rRNA methyltransferase [Anaerolineae bacterium]
MNTPKLILKRGRSKSILRRHPWLFSGGIAKVLGAPDLGSLVAVCDAQDEFLAWAHYSPHSQIRARLFSWQESRVPNGEEFWRERLAQAVALRSGELADAETTACRLVNAESDGVPGLVVDLYGSTLVLQFLTAGSDVRRDLFVELLWDIVNGYLDVERIFERSDVSVRRREGLRERSGLLRGKALEGPITILENGLTFEVDVGGGQKTGFYLDQRDNRQILRGIVQRYVRFQAPPRLLNVFSYTGGFAVYGLSAGAASVVNVDTSEDALAAVRRNLQLNNLDTSLSEDINGSAFKVLRELRQAGARYDVIVLDPPKFAVTQRDVKHASRGYKDINLQALHLLEPGGHLLTFSCSGAISDDLFQKIVFGAALDSGRDIRIVGRMMQSSDHPVALTFPEGAYLKGLICRASKA